MRTKRLGRPRLPAIRTVVAGAFEGTQEIVEAVVKESTHLPAWRPVRAAAALALAGEQHRAVNPWMTTAEFADWVAGFRKNDRGLIQTAVGIAPSRRKSILDGAPISRTEALAIAHYRAGLPLPLPVGDVAAFGAWVVPRFGPVRALSRTLGLSEDYINDRLNGFDITHSARVIRTPEVSLIRAMDWVWRVGPISPYGRRLPGAAFPGQLQED